MQRAATGVSLPVQEELTARDYVRLAQIAEEEGFDTLFAGEIAGIEAFALLGAIAQVTERIRLAPGVVSIYNRSPVLTGMAFATLSSLAPGRIAAGLGTGSHRIVEDWNGRELRAPLTTMREFIAALRAVVAGERVDVHGEEIVVRGYRLQMPSEGPLPVLVGAFNRAMLRLAGEIADGVVLAWSPMEELPDRIADVRDGARRAGRDPDSLEIAVYLQAYAGPHIAEAIERFRRLVLEYAVRPTHRAAFAGSFPEIERATELWNAGERKQALALVPDAAVLRLAPIGDAETVVARIEEARTAGATLPVVFPQSLRRGDAETPAQTLRAVAAALRAGAVT